ncbi:MAG: alkylated DNA repair dioxygenase [Hyphomicrobiales bacterium]|nr:MAG: alkylated DNA repair dioxygenase [Hyphomicrobiales bacterium]
MYSGVIRRDAVQKRAHRGLPELLEAAAAKCLAPGLTLFQRYLDDAAQQALAGEIAEAVLQAPWFLPRMPRSGKAFSVKMTNCGCLGWVSDRDRGYRYQATHPFTGNAWRAIPLAVLNIWRALAFYPHPPEACLVNFYDSKSRMGLHQDRDEADLAAPVVSISLGDSCCFRYGGLRRGDPAKKLELRSGDIVVMGGAARLMFHGVDKIFAGTSSLLPGGGRINLTLRRVTRP